MLRPRLTSIFNCTFPSTLNQVLLLCLGTLAMWSALPAASAQTFNFTEFPWGSTIATRYTKLGTGNCPTGTTPLPIGGECWSTVDYQPDAHFHIVATYHAINNPQGLNGAVVTVTGTITRLDLFAGSIGVGPALYFTMQPSSSISAAGLLHGDCFGIAYGSYIDSALAIGSSYTTGQVDAPCPVFLSVPSSTNNIYISGLDFNIPPGPYQKGNSLMNFVILYNPQVDSAFAPGSKERSIESFEIITKLGPASFLLP
jgi:hypothetical protein